MLVCKFLVCETLWMDRCRMFSVLFYWRMNPPSVGGFGNGFVNKVSFDDTADIPCVNHCFNQNRSNFNGDV